MPRKVAHLRGIVLIVMAGLPLLSIFFLSYRFGGLFKLLSNRHSKYRTQRVTKIHYYGLSITKAFTSVLKSHKEEKE